jgi:hypothetical protein
VHDVHVQWRQAVRHGVRIGQHEVGSAPDARDRVEHVVHVQDGAGPRALQAGQEPARHRAAQVHHVSVAGQASRARPGERCARAREGRQAAEREGLPGVARNERGVAERAGGRGRDAGPPAAAAQGAEQQEEARLGSAGAIDRDDGEQSAGRHAGRR